MELQVQMDDIESRVTNIEYDIPAGAHARLEQDVLELRAEVVRLANKMDELAEALAGMDCTGGDDDEDKEADGD